jgi:myosin-5
VHHFYGIHLSKMYNRQQLGGTSINTDGRPGASRSMQRTGGPGTTPSRPASRLVQPGSNRILSSNRPGPESRSVASAPRNPERNTMPGGRPIQHTTGRTTGPAQNQPTPIRTSPRGNSISSSQPTVHREMGDNYAWVRTELVQAIWNNHGKLPPGWKPSRKRGRDGPSWGWMRAQVLQSSSAAAGGSAMGQHQLRGNGQGKSILATMKIEDELFAPSELRNTTVSFSYELGDNETVCPANTWWKKQDPVAPTDLCSLTHLHEPAVVFCLQQRYQQDIIYTYTGKILLALNPFRVVDGVYGDQVMKEYWKSVSLERPPPHVYAIAQDAYKSLLDMKEDQSVLVSGESGSGKTVTTKIIMGYLATQSRRVQANQNNQKEGVESQILQSNPILESFGNARTMRNDNSSRFGKYMELLFTPSGTLMSASIQTYLLEKVRLITQAPGERNYHVFYELLAGVSQKERQLLKIANVTARDFRMTAASGTFDRRDGVDDRETYQDLRKALDTVGFSKEDQRAMLSVICALLHCSNIDFQPAAGDGSALVKSTSLRCALALLGVPMEALNNALCLCAIEARGEVFHKNMSVSQAEKALEAMIKATYGALFTYIVQQINVSITADHSLDAPVESLPTIGVLDIFGFESFDFNSFEQLCINYCNEALQQQFNRFVFKLEQEEYKQEGIDWSFIDFPDNQDILDLIEKKRVGILSILDENCRLTSQTDSSFVRGVYDKCSNHPRFLGTNTQKANLQFSINHYAGVVTYDCIIFLEKNKDELPKETTELLSSSSVPFLSHLGELLTGDSSSPAANDRKSTISPIKSTSPSNPKNLKRGSSSMIRESVGSQFSNQLRELRSRIDSTTPHYVRCLKPNDQLVPQMFEAHVMADQLRCAGVLEAIRVARVGFPHRFFHDQFLERYGILGKSKLKGLGRTLASQRCISLVNVLLPVVLTVLEREGGNQDRTDLRK